jgi:hypothetical protein
MATDQTITGTFVKASFLGDPMRQFPGNLTDNEVIPLLIRASSFSWPRRGNSM